MSHLMFERAADQARNRPAPLDSLEQLARRMRPW